MFFSRSKSKLGIDIGTSSIKVVQLKRQQQEEKNFLETYGVVNVALRADPKGGFDAIKETAEILKKLVEKANVTTRKVVASLPNNIVFVTMIEMPEMSDKELKAAIEWEARRYVPLPLEEVTLSWSVLRNPAAGAEQKVKVLLTAVPTSVIDNYLKMFKMASLEPVALEIEALALIRSLAGSRKDSLLIIDIGARNTSLNLVDKGFLRVSRNILVGGETITSGIAEGLRISEARAEQFKKDLGLTATSQQIPQAIRPPLDTIKNETSQLINIFEASGGAIQEIIFTGSGARLPGLTQYFSELGPKTAMGDPLKFISFNPAIQASLRQVSLSLSVAVGLAMRE